jgi:hypothetical protein
VTIPPHSAPGYDGNIGGTKPCPHAGCTATARNIGYNVFRCSRGDLTCGGCGHDVDGAVGGPYTCDKACDHH